MMMDRITDILQECKRDSVAILKAHLKSIVARSGYREKMTDRATLHINGIQLYMENEASITYNAEGRFA